MAKIALTAAATAGMITADILTGGATAALHPWLVPLIEGASVGLAIGASLIPPKIPGMAPLQDLQVSSSADGAPIPFGYGMSRFAGQIIWSPGIIYQRSMPPSTGKGGGGQAGRVYIYMAGFAAAFCEGPAKLDRIWADSKLIYKGGNDFGSVSVWNAATAYVEDDLVTYTFYPGIGGRTTQIYRCILANTNIVPNGNALYWEVAPYAYWESSVQYQPGQEIVYPGLTSEVAQSGTVYVCVNPSLNDRPPSSPLHWETTTAYYQAPTIYPGDEVQAPDPTIQSVEGVARTPAFRGLTYAVWELMPLGSFGNRVPNLRAEVRFCTPAVQMPTTTSAMLQKAQGYTGSGFTSITIAFPNPVTAGSLLIAFAFINLSDAPASVISDTLGNTWTSARVGGPTIPAPPTYWDYAPAAWYCISAGGADSVTVHSPGTNLLQLQICEVTGASATLRTSGHNSNNPPTTPSVSTATPTGQGPAAVAGDYAISFLWTAGSYSGNLSGYPFTAGPGYTLRQQQDDPTWFRATATEDGVVAASGNVTASFGMTGDALWGEYLLVFAPAAS